jgi:adenylate cyclase
LSSLLAWWRAPGRVAALVVLLLGAAIQLWDPPPLQMTRARGFDLEQRLLPLPPEGALVPVVDIDEESLRQRGQWPWPRSLVAQLIQRIAAGKPAALGVDILFPEADRFSPPLLARTLPNLPAPLAQELAQLPSSDDELAKAFAEVPTVLGEGPTNTAVPAGASPHWVGAWVRPVGRDPNLYLQSYASMVLSRDEAAKGARSGAALTGEPDPDGVFRTVPLLLLVDGRMIPSLGLEMIRLALGNLPIVVTTGAFGIENVAVGAYTIPTDGNGRAYLRFQPPNPDRYISAAAVLKPEFNPASLTDKLVLLGVTGLGLVDQKFTPLGLTQGIEIHAQLIESILRGTVLHRPAYAWCVELAVVLIGGLIVICLVRYERPVLAGIAALAVTAGLVGGEFAAFRFAGWLVDGIFPAIVALASAGAMVIGNLRAAQIARRRLAAELEHERQLLARTEGELTAARELQLGLLPHRFPPFPERGDLDLYARIEPARAVGGDFFDFQLIDDDHLFFIIADVSGKGVPAALFMEMTMQIVRAAVQRHGCDLSQVLTETNAKTAAASMEMGETGEGMFVTAFAGIVDTASGELLYASAGHDSPFLVGDRGPLRQLETEGGPPLGVLDEFPYPVDHDRMGRNAVLLLYTDGLTEAQDAGGELYSLRRVSAALRTAPATDARITVDACFEAVRQFVGEAEQTDDITILAIRLSANAAPLRAAAAPGSPAIVGSAG